MTNAVYPKRLEKCSRLMKEAGIDVLLLTKPSNMFYFTGDGRLCAYAMVTKDGKVALGVPQTDVEDVKKLAQFEHIAGFEDEVGMIHSMAHDFARFDIEEGVMHIPEQSGHDSGRNRPPFRSKSATPPGRLM